MENRSKPLDSIHKDRYIGTTKYLLNIKFSSMLLTHPLLFTEILIVV